MLLHNGRSRQHSWFKSSSRYQPSAPAEGSSQATPHRAALVSLRSQWEPLDCWHLNHKPRPICDTHTGFKSHLQAPKLPPLLLLPWQQLCSSPHTLLAVSSSLREIAEVTGEVICRTCHQARRLLLASARLWAAVQKSPQPYAAQLHQWTWAANRAATTGGGRSKCSSTQTPIPDIGTCWGSGLKKQLYQHGNGEPKE